MCVIVANLPDDAAVWRALHPHGIHTRTDLLLAAMERRITILWATVAAALGQDIPDEHLTGPLDALDTRQAQAGTEPETRSLREIAVWMRG